MKKISNLLSKDYAKLIQIKDLQLHKYLNVLNNMNTIYIV